jgi:hypothetical protein
LLGYQEREVKELQQMLYNVTEQVKNEKQRADNADRKALEAAHRFRNAENARIIAEQNATRTNEVIVTGFCFLLFPRIMLTFPFPFRFVSRNCDCTKSSSRMHKRKYIGPRRFLPPLTVSDRKQRRKRRVLVPQLER